MNAALACLGLVCLLLAGATPVAPYHIREDTYLPALLGATDPTEWRAQVTGQPVVCEGDGDGVHLPAHSGLGGLCYMSPGFISGPGSSCTFNTGDDGNSDGLDSGCNAMTYRDLPPTTSASTTTWFRITMQDQPDAGPLAGHNVKFTAVMAGISCSVTSDHVIYDEMWADTVSNGHVTGVPIAQPAGGPTDAGGYSAEFWAPGPATTDTDCSGTLPFYQ